MNSSDITNGHPSILPTLRQNQQAKFLVVCVCIYILGNVDFLFCKCYSHHHRARNITHIYSVLSLGHRDALVKSSQQLPWKSFNYFHCKMINLIHFAQGHMTGECQSQNLNLISLGAKSVPPPTPPSGDDAGHRPAKGRARFELKWTTSTSK